jgi:hypothetical protein
MYEVTEHHRGHHSVELNRRIGASGHSLTGALAGLAQPDPLPGWRAMPHAPLRVSDLTRKIQNDIVAGTLREEIADFEHRE